MKNLVMIIPLLLPGIARADLITLKDGTRIEGAIEGEMEGVTVIRTQYGALNIKKSDIVSQVPGAPAEPLPAAPAVSTGTAAVLPPPEPLPPPPVAGAEYTFRTVTLDTMSFQRVYFENGVSIATETFDTRGSLLAQDGRLKDGVYREYYDNGNLKTEKTVADAKVSGTLKAYYPGGVLQSVASYQAGLLDGAVRIYGENSRLLFEQNFRAGVPDGYFREFDETGVIEPTPADD